MEDHQTDNPPHQNEQSRKISILEWIFALILGTSLLFSGASLAAKNYPTAVCFLIVPISFIATTAFVRSGKLKVGFRSRVAAIVTDPKIRSVFALIFILAFLGYAISFVYTLRKDLDDYVMPRTLSKKQTKNLSKILRAHHSDVVVDVLANPLDQEAYTYAGQILTALKAGEWEAQFAPFDPGDLNKPGLTGNRRLVAQVLMSRGVGIFACYVGQPKNPDPKHPNDKAILADAFKNAEIEGGGGGDEANCPEYSITIVISGRPLSLEVREPMLFRLSDWIRQVAQKVN